MSQFHLRTHTPWQTGLSSGAPTHSRAKSAENLSVTYLTHAVSRVFHTISNSPIPQTTDSALVRNQGNNLPVTNGRDLQANQLVVNSSIRRGTNLFRFWILYVELMRTRHRRLRATSFESHDPRRRLWPRLFDVRHRVFSGGSRVCPTHSAESIL